MIRYSLMLVVIGFVAASTGYAQDTKLEKKELMRLQGIWKPVKLLKSGKPAPQKILDSLELKFAGSKIYPMRNGEVEKKGAAKFTIDPAKKPRWINIMPQAGPEKDTVIKGIYELKGDMLTICFPTDDKDARPKELKSSEDNGTTIGIFRRKKVEKDKD